VCVVWPSGTQITDVTPTTTSSLLRLYYTKHTPFVFLSSIVQHVEPGRQWPPCASKPLHCLRVLLLGPPHLDQSPTTGERGTPGPRTRRNNYPARLAWTAVGRSNP
jgi:hypothetical protein